MKEEKVDEIMDKVLLRWIKTFGLENIDPQKAKMLRQILKQSPHDDGYMRITLIEEPGITYLVPFEDIILNGIKGEDVKKYPIENE